MKRLLFILFVLGLLISGVVAANNNGKLTQSSISVEALKGQAATDLVIGISPDVAEARKIAVKAYNENGTLKFTRNFQDVNFVNGTAVIQFDDLQEEDRVDVDVQLDKGIKLESFALVLLRPDLVINKATSEEKIIAGEAFWVNVTVAEINNDRGADAVVVLMEGDSVLATAPVALAAGEIADVRLSAVLASAGTHSLSVIILNSVPSEYDETNNVHELAVTAVLPDLAVTNVTAPVYAGIGERFEVVAGISELSGYAGAAATVSLLEGSTVLESTSLEVQANSSAAVSFNINLTSSGTHNITVRITESVPIDSDPGNNEMEFTVTVHKSPQAMSFTLRYYYQHAYSNISRYISDSGYAESGEEQELNEDETVSFTASSSRSIDFPLRMRVGITNGTGEWKVFEETGIVPVTEGSKSTFRKYYNESSALLTLSVDETGTKVSLEIISNASAKHSEGYTYWWFKGTQEWNITTDSGSGALIRANSSVLVNIELEDAIQFLGGNALMNVTGEGYSGGWVDTTSGTYEENRQVYVYNGNGSGETVI